MIAEFLPMETETQPILCRVSMPQAISSAIKRLHDAAYSIAQAKHISSDLAFRALKNTLVSMKSLSIMVWNTSGAGNNYFLNALHDLIRLYAPSVIALVEPRISGDDADRVCNRIGYDGRIRMEVVGFSGGIWLLWRKDEVVVTPIRTETQHITVEIHRRGEEPWILSAIYAAPH